MALDDEWSKDISQNSGTVGNGLGSVRPPPSSRTPKGAVGLLDAATRFESGGTLPTDSDSVQVKHLECLVSRLVD